MTYLLPAPSPHSLSSYFIPIALLLFRGRDLLPPAYWRLPSTLAKACNLISLLYITFISVLFCRTSCPTLSLDQLAPLAVASGVDPSVLPPLLSLSTQSPTSIP